MEYSTVLCHLLIDSTTDSSLFKTVPSLRRFSESDITKKHTQNAQINIYCFTISNFSFQTISFDIRRFLLPILSKFSFDNLYSYTSYLLLLHYLET